MTAEELRRDRADANQARRERQMWPAAMGGRTGLSAPLGPPRTRGAVQSPSLGTVSELGETHVFHMRGPLIVDSSDPYPVISGGAPLLLIASNTPPTAAELDVLRNGAVVDTIALVFTAGLMEYQVTEVYVRTDFYELDLTDPGTGGDGLVVATEFRASLT